MKINRVLLSCLFIGAVTFVGLSHGTSVTPGKMVKTVIEGSTKLTEVIKRFDTMFLKPITDEVDREIAKIDVQMDGLQSDEIKLITDARKILVKSREDVTGTREILNLLAMQTISRSKAMVQILNKLLSNSVSEADRSEGVKQAVEKMKDLLLRSKRLLGDATARCADAQVQIKVVQEKLRIFRDRVTELADRNGSRHKRRASEMRKKVYGGVAAGCIFIFACPFIYATAAGVLESEIKKWEGRVNRARAQCQRSAQDAIALADKLGNDVKSMQSEGTLISNWDSKIATMYDEFKGGNYVENARDWNEFIEGHSVNQLNDLIAACEAFKLHTKQFIG